MRIKAWKLVNLSSLSQHHVLRKFLKAETENFANEILLLSSLRHIGCSCKDPNEIEIRKNISLIELVSKEI